MFFCDYISSGLMGWFQCGGIFHAALFFVRDVKFIFLHSGRHLFEMYRGTRLNAGSGLWFFFEKKYESHKKANRDQLRNWLIV